MSAAEASPGGRSARQSDRTLLLILLAVLGTTLGSADPPRAWRRPARAPARLALASTDDGTREIDVTDLAFVFYDRTYYHKRAPRSEDASGRRVDIEDKREECACLRFEDRSKVKFDAVRQIEIDYPEDGREARLRVTERDGSVREVGAGSLSGASTSLAPRFAATVDGVVREFPLILGGVRGKWICGAAKIGHRSLPSLVGKGLLRCCGYSVVHHLAAPRSFQVGLPV